MTIHFVLLPGDGIGPEVIAESRKVLERLAALQGYAFSFSEYAVGGNAIDAVGDPLPESTLDACRDADAVLLGAVGGPRWDDPTAKVRPESGLLALRKELGLYANLRPIRAIDELVGGSPLRPELIRVSTSFFSGNSPAVSTSVSNGRATTA